MWLTTTTRTTTLRISRITRPKIIANPSGLWLLVLLAMARTEPSQRTAGSSGNNLLLHALGAGHRTKASNYYGDSDNGQFAGQQRDNETFFDFQLLDENRQQRPEIPITVIYQTGQSEADLPECGEREVCNKIDMYGDPWVERMCRCSSGRTCSSVIDPNDGHTIVDKTRQFKLCEPVSQLPKCRYFKDITWTITAISGPNNRFVYKAYCMCQPNDVTYLLRWPRSHPEVPSTVYPFACSPQSLLKCRTNEPCRLFTMRRKTSTQLKEVTVTTLCQCKKGTRCPSRHTDRGSRLSTYANERHSSHVYSGHCHPDEDAYDLF